MGNVSRSPPGSFLNSSSLSASAPRAPRTSSPIGPITLTRIFDGAISHAIRRPVMSRSPCSVSRKYQALLRSSSAFSMDNAIKRSASRRIASVGIDSSSVSRTRTSAPARWLQVPSVGLKIAGGSSSATSRLERAFLNSDISGNRLSRKATSMVAGRLDRTSRSRSVSWKRPGPTAWSRPAFLR